MNVCSYSDKTLKVQVNCVDTSSKELIHSYIIRIDTETPTISNLYDIQCEVAKESIQRIYYYNRDTQPSDFTF